MPSPEIKCTLKCARSLDAICVYDVNRSNVLNASNIQLMIAPNVVEWLLFLLLATLYLSSSKHIDEVDAYKSWAATNISIYYGFYYSYIRNIAMKSVCVSS